MPLMIVLVQPISFAWNSGNKNKNLKHKVNDQECEEVFFDAKKIISKDVRHSHEEERHLLIGKTKRERLLFIVFTLRGNQVRVISARDLNKRERHLYEKAT